MFPPRLPVGCSGTTRFEAWNGLMLKVETSLCRIKASSNAVFVSSLLYGMETSISPSSVSFLFARFSHLSRFIRLFAIFFPLPFPLHPFLSSFHMSCLRTFYLRCASLFFRFASLSFSRYLFYALRFAFRLFASFLVSSLFLSSYLSVQFVSNLCASCTFTL